MCKLKLKYDALIGLGLDILRGGADQLNHWSTLCQRNLSAEKGFANKI